MAPYRQWYETVNGCLRYHKGTWEDDLDLIIVGTFKSNTSLGLGQVQIPGPKVVVTVVVWSCLDADKRDVSSGG